MDEVSIPPPGVEPVDPTLVSPRLKVYYEKAESAMMLRELEVDSEAMGIRHSTWTRSSRIQTRF